MLTRPRTICPIFTVAGALPPSLGNLEKLHSMQVGGNNLQGRSMDPKRMLLGTSEAHRCRLRLRQLCFSQEVDECLRAPNNPSFCIYILWVPLWGYALKDGS